MYDPTILIISTESRMLIGGQLHTNCLQMAHRLQKFLAMAVTKTTDDFSLDHLVTEANNKTLLSKTRIVEKNAFCF